MPSPFPGMDPFLESPRHFSGLHGSLITYAMGALQLVLPDGYFASSGERIWIEATGGQREPDFNVIRQHAPTPGGNGRASAPASAVATGASPVLVVVPHETRRQRFLEVVRQEGDAERIVAVFEILSPSNKRSGPGRDEYLRKQREVAASAGHLIEIDLLRGGTPATNLPAEWAAAHAGEFTYHACVTRSDLLTQYEIYPIGLRNRLPTISIPLAADEGAVPLDLQAVFEQAYEVGPYAKRVDYADPSRITPPLSPDDATWAAEIAAARG